MNSHILTSKEKIFSLRKLMLENNIDMYLVPSTDAHNSEYVPECWQRRAFISNFTGSAGEVLITKDNAYLSTDGRYFLQAEQELDLNIFEIIKQQGFSSELNKVIANNINGKVLAVDSNLVSISNAKTLQEIAKNNNGKILFMTNNLIDDVVINLEGNLAKLRENKVFHLPLKYTGEKLVNKLEKIRNELKKEKVQFLVLNSLDEIAWLFNVRGSDIDFNPLFLSYAVISEENVYLFTNTERLGLEVKSLFVNENVTLKNYNEFHSFLGLINRKVWLDDKVSNYNIKLSLQNAEGFFYKSSPIIDFKSQKNNVEIQGTINAHIKDAVAVCELLSWLENNINNKITELDVVDKLYKFRTMQKDFMGNSFDTISGFKSNGAIIHYKVNEKTNKTLSDDGIFLLDSGGQYLQGTTDITRTSHFGKPSAEEKENYTYVLKGHLALARQIFPQNTFGENLDVLARQFLWNKSLNFRHGTGHGVGSFLCVHEGPQKISSVSTQAPLKKGMIVSNEPGYYKDGAYGIRVENLIFVENELENEYGQFFKFENLTVVPYCKNLIDVSLLTNQEKEQIAKYYNDIEEKIYSDLSENAKEWFKNELSLLELF